MKKIYSLSILLLISIAVWSQTKTWNAGNGAWNVANNWTPAGVPAANNLIIFNTGAAVTITNVPTIELNKATITGNTQVILQGTASNIISLNDATGTDLVIDGGSSLGLGTNFNLTLNNNADATITGTLTVNAGSSYVTGGGNSVTTVTATGTIDNKGTVNSSQNGSLAFAAGGTYLHSQNGGVIPEASWNNASNCIVTGVINQMPTGFAQEFGNFEWNSTAQVPFGAPATPSFGGQLTNIDGDLIIKSTGTGAIYLANSFNFQTTVDGDYIQTGGTLVINQTGGNGNLLIEGNFNMSGGVLARNSPLLGGNSSTVYFDGSAEQTFTKTGGTISGPLAFVIPEGSVVNFGTSVLDGTASTFTLQSGAKLITSNPAGLNSAGAFGPIQTATRTFSTDADYEFRGANTGIFNTGVSTNTTPSLVRNLTINNSSGTVTLSKPVTIQ